jgi:hypothetical protein
MPGSEASEMSVPVVEDVLVDLVRDREAVVLEAQVADQLSSARVKTLPHGLAAC